MFICDDDGSGSTDGRNIPHSSIIELLLTKQENTYSEMLDVDFSKNELKNACSGWEDDGEYYCNNGVKITVM